MSDTILGTDDKTIDRQGCDLTEFPLYIEGLTVIEKHI